MPKPIPIPQLRAKLDLLPGDLHHAKDEVRAAAIRRQDDPSKALDGPRLCRAIASDRLSMRYVASLLRLYGLKQVPQQLDPGCEDHAPWFSLVQETSPAAFAARVRLLGGEVEADPPGAAWDRFFQDHAARAARLGTECIRFHRLDQPPPRAAGAYRALPPGHWALNPSRTSVPAAPPIPLLTAGERVSVMLSLGNALPVRPQRMHLLCFFDVREGGARQTIPLLPAPAMPGIEMPPPYSDDALFEIPRNPSRSNCLVVDSGWDERALMVLVTDRALDPELLEDTLDHGPILLERLDLLATRLQDPSTWPPQRWALMRLPYQVTRTLDAGPQPQAA